MKTENEIRNKIDELNEFYKANKYDGELVENALCQIDMLLWILDDKSGLPPIDERKVMT